MFYIKRLRNVRRFNVCDSSPRNTPHTVNVTINYKPGKIRKMKDQHMRIQPAEPAHKSSHLTVGTMCIALGMTLFAGMAAAQSVTLSARDGTFNTTGNLVSYENGNYVIETALGEMVVAADTVVCEGVACPALSPALPSVPVLPADPATPKAAVAAPADSHIVFYGSDTVGLGLMPLLLSGYAASEEGDLVTTGTEKNRTYEILADGGYGDSMGKFQVISTVSGDAFKALLRANSKDGQRVYGMASRRIKPAEARALSQDGAGNMIDIGQEHIVAIDALIPIVNPENPVSRISIDNLGAIYRGKITNWSEVGGPDMPITVYTRPDGSGTRAVFEKRVLGNSMVQAVAKVAETNSSMADMVSKDPGAIGYVGQAFVQDNKPLALQLSCGITVNSDTFSAKTEEYPLERRLYLYNRKVELDVEASDFLRYATSSEADGVVAKSGFIDLGIARQSHQADQTRIQELVGATNNNYELNLMRELLVEMFQWDRLTTTLRFSPGSDHLERKSVQDMVRLIDYLATQPDGTEVYMVGFTDSDGAFTANQKLSKRRAQAAIDDLKAFAGSRVDHISFAATGYGELAPAACNYDNKGKSINRRVEVWIRNPQ